MMKKVLIMLLVFLTVSATNAWAEEADDHFGFYLILGVPIMPIAQYNGEDVDGTAIGIDMLAGYHFSKYFAVEGDIQIIAYETVEYYAYSPWRLQLTGTDIKVGGIFNYPIGSFRPYVGAGAMYSALSLELTTVTVSASSYTDNADSGLGVYGKAGVKFGFGHQKRYLIDAGVEYASRFMDYNLSTLSVRIGVGYMF